MRVVVHPADRNACGHYRLVWPGEALAAQGHDVRIEHDTTYNCLWQDSLIQGPTVIGLAEPPDADVVVMQRPLTRHRLEFQRALQAEGVAVVVEIDDDFSAIHPRNPAWKGANPLTNPDASRDWLTRACREADLVTCTTQALADRYGDHGRCMILDNYVPERYLQIPRADDERDAVLVGWTGSVYTHPGDLEVTEGGVASAITRGPKARLSIVGTAEGIAPALGYNSRPVVASGWVDLYEYPSAVAALDVGFVPLVLSQFNEAKSHLKGLEMASVGVPFVATPTGPYRRLHDAGIGWLAKSPAEWRFLVAQLIQDASHRKALSDQWRALVAEQWTVEANAWRWLEAWSLAVENRRSKVAA